MLTGHECGEKSFLPAAQLTEMALDRLNRFDFVGVTEMWSESVAAFARRYSLVQEDKDLSVFRPSKHPDDAKKLWAKQWFSRAAAGSPDEAIYNASVARLRAEEPTVAEVPQAHDSREAAPVQDGQQQAPGGGMPGRRLTAVERFFGTGYPHAQVARTKCRLQIATSHTGYSQLLNDEASVKEPLKLPYFLKAALINLEVVWRDGGLRFTPYLSPPNFGAELTGGRLNACALCTRVCTRVCTSAPTVRPLYTRQVVEDKAAAAHRAGVRAQPGDFVRDAILDRLRCLPQPARRRQRAAAADAAGPRSPWVHASGGTAIGTRGGGGAFHP